MFQLAGFYCRRLCRSFPRGFRRALQGSGLSKIEFRSARILFEFSEGDVVANQTLNPDPETQAP